MLACSAFIFPLQSTIKQYLVIQKVNFTRRGLVVEPRTPEREVGGSIPTSTVLCP